MASDRSNDSAPVKLFTDAPWNGTRTPEFRKFKRDFKVGANGMFLHEDDYSIWSALQDLDQGGASARVAAGEEGGRLACACARLASAVEAASGGAAGGRARDRVVRFFAKFGTGAVSGGG